MKEQRKKEIEAKWQELLDQADKSAKTKSEAKSNNAPAGARVIRRRKGSRDLPIS